MTDFKISNHTIVKPIVENPLDDTAQAMVDRALRKYIENAIPVNVLGFLGLHDGSVKLSNYMEDSVRYGLGIYRTNCT